MFILTFPSYLLYCSPPPNSDGYSVFKSHAWRERNRNSTCSRAEQQFVWRQSCSSPPVIEKGFDPETTHVSPCLFQRVAANVAGQATANCCSVIFLATTLLRGTFSGFQEEILLLILTNANKFLN